jgi:hypothetical protein
MVQHFVVNVKTSDSNPSVLFEVMLNEEPVMSCVSTDHPSVTVLTCNAILPDATCSHIANIIQGYYFV